MGPKYRNIIFTVFFMLLLPVAVLPYGLSISKTESKTTATSGETLTFCLSVVPQKITSVTKADIIWVVDVTESMKGSVLTSIKNNISYFTSELSAGGIDYRQGLVSFRDSTYTHITYDADVNYGFASTDSQFLSWVNNLSAYEGGDTPETGLDALADAAGNNTWRDGASKMLILITDARLKCRDDGNGPLSMTYTAASIYSRDISIYSISPDYSSTIYKGNPKKLAFLTAGSWLDITSTAAEWTSFLGTIVSDTGRYTNVIVTDTLPSPLSFAGSACDAVISGNLAAWNIPYIPAGSTYTVCCFTAYVNSPFSGCIFNTAYVSADTVPLTGSNTTLLCYVTPTITKTVTLTRTTTPTCTLTLTCTATSTQTPAATFTPTCSATPSNTSTPTATLTGTFSPTESGTTTVTITPTSTNTPTATATQTSTPILTPTVSPTETFTSTFTPVLSPTASPTITCTYTITTTTTTTLTAAATFTWTLTTTITAAPAISLTPTRTPEVALSLELKGNYPNPFDTDTNFVYKLSRDADIKIKIFTVSGEVVRKAGGIKGHAGYNSYYWDGKNNSGRSVASGIFILKMTASAGAYGEKSAMQKCSCVR